jgi:hypothetical protein
MCPETSVLSSWFWMKNMFTVIYVNKTNVSYYKKWCIIIYWRYLFYCGTKTHFFKQPTLTRVSPTDTHNFPFRMVRNFAGKLTHRVQAHFHTLHFTLLWSRFKTQQFLITTTVNLSSEWDMQFARPLWLMKIECPACGVRRFPYTFEFEQTPNVLIG